MRHINHGHARTDLGILDEMAEGDAMSDGSRGGVVGRAGPLQRLGEVVTASLDGRASAVLVSGEAGIGKTSLIRAALDGAGENSPPGRVAAGWGTCWHGDGAPGF